MQYHLEQLDNVLSILNEQIDLEYAYIPVYEWDNQIDVSKQIVSKQKYLNYNDISAKIIDDNTRNELELIINFLIHGGYVDVRSDGINASYRLTFNGRVLANNGGFRVKSVNDAKALEAKIYRDYLMIFGTFLAGIGGISVALIEILKKFGFLLSIEFFSFAFVFLFGLIAGIIIYMLISEGLSRRKQG